MNSSKLTTALTAILLLSTASARANHEPAFAPEDPNNFWVEAQVVDVKPLARVVTVTTPQEVCRNDEVWNPASTRRSRTPLIAGGILGGVVGNQFGGGRGQDLLTIAGALLGASIGSDVANHNSPPAGYKTVEQVCNIEQANHGAGHHSVTVSFLTYRKKPEPSNKLTNWCPAPKSLDL